MSAVQLPKYVPIERVEFPTVEEFRRLYDQPQKPVVITGAMRDWKAMDEWDHGWFKSFNNIPVSLSLERAHIKRSKTTTISKYVESILNDTDGGHYMDQFPFKNIPQLDTYVKPVYAPVDQKNMLHLWLGPAHTEISFHKDNHDPYLLISNIFAQICGRKRVLLVSPDQDDAMYARPFDPQAPDQGAFWHSQVDHNQPDFERFPKFRNVRILEAILHPGEMLFVPGDYWHSVRALDKSISVSCWWHTYRLVALGLAGIDALQERKPFEPISIADVDAFGGVGKLLLVMDMFEQKNPGARQVILSLCKPDVSQRVKEAQQSELSGAK